MFLFIKLILVFGSKRYKEINPKNTLVIGLEISRTCLHYVLEIRNFTNCRTYFLTNTFTNTTFQIPEYVKQSKKLNVHMFNNNPYVKFLKQRMFVFRV